jgi:hypothetical protein
MALFAQKAITSSGEPLGTKHYLKIFVACISYANLCFLNQWAEIFGHSWDFMRRYALTWQTVSALALDILIVGTLLCGVVCFVLRIGNQKLVRGLKWAMLLALLLPLNVIRTDEAFLSLKQIQIHGIGSTRTAVIVAGIVVGIFLVFTWERFSARFTTAVLTLVAPAMALALGAAMMRIADGPPGGLYPNLPLQPALPQPADAPHVVWVIFDEWDDHLTFHQRPPGIDLPAIDRFAGESLHANHVVPPAILTVVSVPSLLTGKTFREAQPVSPTELMLVSDPAKPAVPFSAQETIFATARKRGWNVGIAGWFLPYCRLIPECTVCSWHAAIGVAARMQYEEPPTVRSLMAQDLIVQAQEVPLYRFGINLDLPIHQELHGRTYSQVREDMLGALTDRRLNLLFIHINVPHGPMVYDARQERLSTGQHLNYADNLRLTDRTVAEIRQRLERAGMWENSTVLLTADHPLRVSYFRMRTLNADNWPTFVPAGATQHSDVPYLLKMAGQKKGITYNQEMQEVVTKELLLAILGKQVTTPEQAAAWLDQHSAITKP